MYSVKKLHSPVSLEAALCLLAGEEKALPLAGGTDILVKMRGGELKDVSLVSLAKLAELREIAEDENGDILIGSAVTFTDVAQSPIVGARVPMLCTAALSMGGPQIQNVATIGGNVCNGATSADSAPSLFALDAMLELRSAEKTRCVPIGEFYTGPGKTVRRPDELLVSIRLPIARKERWGGVYLKYSTRKAMDISTLGCAAVCELDADGATVRRAAIALGTAAPTPVRCTEAESLLDGKIPTAELMEQVGQAARNATNPRTSWRATKEYREALAEESAQRAFMQAYQQAKGETL